MLTKTDFTNYIDCPLHLWLSKNRPDLIPDDTPEQERIFAMGREVDQLSKKLFPGGFEIEGFGKKGFENAKKALQGSHLSIFQPTIIAGELSCRADIIARNGNNWDIHEVKMATKVKKEYVYDVGFQYICFLNAGVKVGALNLVHINDQYVREGEIDPQKLFVSEDITDDIHKKLEEIKVQILEAQKIIDIQDPALVVNLCSNPKYCEFLEYYCGGSPEVYGVLDRIDKKHLLHLLERELIDYKKVPGELLESVAFETPTEFAKIDKGGIKAVLSKLQYPLYFFDYETYASAIPPFNGTKPYQNIPFQYSLMIRKTKKGKVAHKEFLARKFENPINELLEQLSKDFGPKGSVIVWFAPFETKRNEEMAEAAPDFAEFLQGVNARMFDLMLIFKHKNQLYIRSDFKKLASLKVILPVLCPKLSYDSLAIRNGSMASGAWPVLTSPDTPKKEKTKLAKDMIEYCKRDTQAMVSLLDRIYKDIA